MSGCQETNPAATLGSTIDIRSISKRFGQTLALDDVSFKIDAGEFVTLLGPSGSGKTTLLNIIAGFVQADAGDVVVGGRSIIHMQPRHRGLGVVFQNYALFPHLSVFDNIAFPLRMRRMKKAEIDRMVHDALDLVRLERLEKRFPNQLSGGQQQRVALARSIVFKPPILLMDEPLGALDKKLREQLQIELRRLHRSLDVTVVYVTHDQDEALSLSDRIAVMDQGRIMQVGPTEELYERPRSEFVAAFLGESNFLDGTVAEVADEHVLVRVGSLVFPAASLGTIVADGHVRMYIRPDRIRLVEGGEGTHKVSIEEAVYLGETIRTVVRFEEGLRLVARVPSREASFGVGDGVCVTWSSSDLRIIESNNQGG